MNNKSMLDIQTICFDCAKALGYVMKDKAVGVWTDKCEVCHERKPCTNLHHDWRKKAAAEKAAAKVFELSPRERKIIKGLA